MQTSKTTRKPPAKERFNSFDVTCVIGTVQLDDRGTEPPGVVAFKLIAEHDAQGEFSFPRADGSTCVVNVEYQNVPKRLEEDRDRDF